MITLNQININKEYTYNDILSMFRSNGQNFEVKLFGKELIGENFLVIKKNNWTTTFILTGIRGDEFIYKCIYKD